MIAFDVYVLNLFMCAQTWAIIAQMLIFVYTLCVSVDVPGVQKKTSLILLQSPIHQTNA